MYAKMANRLAVIPARGGSKRIPRKNIKDFLGKPIILRVLDEVAKSNQFDEIHVLGVVCYWKKHSLTPSSKTWSCSVCGGTAVDLLLGHRVSVDFDFFSNKELNRK